MEKIVVGMDDSDHAARALRWAATEATLRDATLVAVHAWSIPATTYSTFTMPLVDSDAMQRAAEETLHAATALAARDTGVVVEERVVEGPAAQALLHEADDAALLVVGSRGHGGFAGLLLGSVSQQLVHHARCPVVVVPHDRLGRMHGADEPADAPAEGTQP